MKPLKVIRLEVENIKRIKVATVVPDQSNPIVMVRGDNGEGKTSLMDSIALGIGGARLQPPKVIREGAEEASVVIDLGDLVVERTWSKGGRGQLEVRNKDGVAQKSPQALLDSLTSRFSFDPVAFLGLKPTEQAEQVRVALGLDFAQLDHEREERFAERTLVNRELERLKARLSALPKPQPDAAPVHDLQALLVIRNKLTAAQLERQNLLAAAREANAKRDAMVSEYRALSAALNDTETALSAAEAEVQRLKQRVADTRLQLGAVEERGKKAKEEAMRAMASAQEAPDVDLDIADVDMKLAEANGNAEAASKAKERELVASELKTKEDESNALTARLEAIDAEKARQTAAAKFPVQGLEYTSGGLRFKGVPFEQASQAERLRVSVAMGLASNPRLRVLLVREASLLDSKSLALLSQIAAEHDAQVWAEMVSEDGKGPCVVIRDGEVAEVRTS